MLQAADPEGTAHIRMEGGVPRYAEHKPGYYDGPYEYIDENDNYVITNQGSKVDISCKSPSDIIWDSHWTPWGDSPEIAWEKIKSRFIVDFGAYAVKEQREERADRFFKARKEEFDEMVASQKPSWENYLAEVINKYKNGWRFYQCKDEKSLKYYDWKIISPLGINEGGANLATSCPILESGLFCPVEIDKENPSLLTTIKNILFGKDKKEYVEWILK